MTFSVELSFQTHELQKQTKVWWPIEGGSVSCSAMLAGGACASLPPQCEEHSRVVVELKFQRVLVVRRCLLSNLQVS